MAGVAMWKLRSRSGVSSLFSALPGRHAAQTGDRHGQIESPLIHRKYAGPVPRTQLKARMNCVRSKQKSIVNSSRNYIDP